MLLSQRIKFLLLLLSLLTAKLLLIQLRCPRNLYAVRRSGQTIQKFGIGIPRLTELLIQHRCRLLYIGGCGGCSDSRSGFLCLILI